MSFKHNKFEDSEIMRSLEKVAVQKGLVKSEPAKEMRKEASNNLSATGNLTQDIVKLCSGLRASGFIAQANEIEKNFIMFKQAETLYQTSKETGKDLVDAAHPDGSHQLKDLKHKVLTITDRHEVLLDKVNKKPTGKLATSSDIIKAVKMALGQQNFLQTYNESYNSIVDNFKELYSSYEGILNKAKEMGVDVLNDDDYKADLIFKRVDRILGSKIRLPKSNQIISAIPSKAALQELRDKLKNAYDRIKPHGVFNARGVSAIDWEDLEPLFTNNIFALIGEIETSADAARTALNSLQSMDPKKQLSEFAKKINSKLEIISSIITWLTDTREESLSLNNKPISVRKLIKNLSKDKEDLEKSLRSVTKRELSIDNPQLVENLAIIDKRIQKVTALQDAYSNKNVDEDDKDDSGGGADGGAGKDKGEVQIEIKPTPPPVSQITGTKLQEKMTVVYNTTKDLLNKFSKITTTPQNKPQIDQIKKTLVDYSTPMDKYMPGVTNIAQIEAPEAWKTATKIGQSLDNNVYFSTIDKIISARQEALKKINTTLLQLTELAAADDGIFSAATLNSIKALKISLAEGFELNFEEEEDKVKPEDDKKYHLLLVKSYLSNALKRINSFYADLKKLDLKSTYTHARALYGAQSSLEEAFKIITEQNNVENFKKSDAKEIENLLYTYLRHYNNDKNALTADELKVFEQTIGNIAKAKDDVYHAGNIAFGEIDEYNQSLIEKLKFKSLIKSQELEKPLLKINSELTSLSRKSKSALDEIAQLLASQGIKNVDKYEETLNKLEKVFRYIQNECNKAISSQQQSEKESIFSNLNEKYKKNYTSVKNAHYWIIKEERVDSLIDGLMEAALMFKTNTTNPESKKEYSEVVSDLKKLKSDNLPARQKEDIYNKIVDKYKKVFSPSEESEEK